MTYAAVKFSIPQAHLQMGWGWFILEAVFYISGAAVHAYRYPERAWPGTCDVIGSSHQIFHVSVLLGALSHLTGIARAFEYNHNPVTQLC
jgi:adiponectin receptor